VKNLLMCHIIIKLALGGGVVYEVDTICFLLFSFLSFSLTLHLQDRSCEADLDAKPNNKQRRIVGANKELKLTSECSRNLADIQIILEQRRTMYKRYSAYLADIPED